MFKRTAVNSALVAAFGSALTLVAQVSLAQTQPAPEQPASAPEAAASAPAPAASAPAPEPAASEPAPAPAPAPAAAPAPQPAPAAAAPRLERVEVTGSAIKRSEVEGPAPVEVYNRREISRTGATTVNELLKSIPSIDIFDQGELASNSPAGSGTGNIGMRGLDSSNVLVLLNGRRLPVNGLYDSSGAGAAVDINMIPLAAIERIEILKDGGSAIYGADAVAGVFNIITKKDYEGIEARAMYGDSTRGGGREKSAGLTAGFGDLSKDKFNVLFGLDVFKRDPIFRRDRDISSSVDFRRFGGPDARSTFAPAGNILDPVLGTFPGVPYSTCAPQDLDANNTCRYDFNASLLTAYNGADRTSTLTAATFELTPDIRAFAEFTRSRTKDYFEGHPVPDFFNLPITDPATQGAFEDPDNPGTVAITGRFMQGGPRITNRRSTLNNIVVGAEGFAGNVDWRASLSRGESKVSNSDANYYDANLWNPATIDGSLNPTVDTNDPAFVESLKVRPFREGKSTVTTANVQIGGDATELPAGTLRYAVGASVWEEKLVDTPDPLSQAGEVIGSIGQSAVNASRRAKAVFGELAIPIQNGLEGQLAVRHDDYPEGRATSPKAAVKYTASPTLAFRGSYTRSFRVPALKQLYGGQEEGAITITDDAQCAALGAACPLNAFQINGSNPDLKPEKGTTWNLGVLADFNPNLSVGLDYWKIDKTNEINSPTVDSAIEQGLVTRDGARFLVSTNLQNLAVRESSGVDVDVRLRGRDEKLGAISVRNMLTYNIHNRRQDDPTSPLLEFNGTYATPRFRNTLMVTSELPHWTFQGAIRTVGGFKDSDDPPVAAGTPRVPTYEEVDVQAQYTGFGALTLTAGVRNLLDRQPPFSAQNASDNAYTQMGFAELYNNRGRFIYLGLNYKFR